MKKKIRMIEETLNEFSDRLKKNKDFAKMMQDLDINDSWDEEEKEEEEEIVGINVNTSDMESAEEIEVDDTMSDDELQIALNNELKIPEFNRSILTFRISGDLENIYNGVPMAQMTNGEAFLFKMNDGKLKKVYLKDIVLEQQRTKNNRARTINE
jgi:hypothetical protein